jgi:hypothetical protein
VPFVIPMKSAVPLCLLAAIGVAPMLVSAACGGRLASDGETDAKSQSARADNGEPSPTPPAHSSPADLAPCPADSTPLPMPYAPDPKLVAQCEQFCERNFTCVGCTYGTCLPNCMFDALATRPSGAPYVAWMTCLLAHEATCGPQPACDAEYCAYVRSASSPSAPLPIECHL